MGPEWSAPDHVWADEKRLTDLVIELVEAAGTSNGVISKITIYQGFVAVERGPQILPRTKDFRLDKVIVRRPTNGSVLHSSRKLKRFTNRIRRFISNRFGAS